MLSFQEMTDKAEKQLREVKAAMSNGVWHPEDASIFTGLKLADAYEIKETFRSLSLAEFLAKSSVTGAAYLVPDKLHDDLIMWSKENDVPKLISAQVVSEWQGGDLKVDIVDDDSYKAQEFKAGGTIPVEVWKTTQATCTPISFGIHPRITNDLIEDNSWGLVEYHMRTATNAIMRKSTDLALTVLQTATDGWGTVNSGATTDVDETKYTGAAGVDIVDAVGEIGDDEWVANTVVCMSEAWKHSILISGPAAYIPTWASKPLPDGFNVEVALLDIKVVNSPVLHASSDAPGATPTNCITLIFDRNHALLTGRKRWMQMENYSDPINDLAGAVISCRQDSVTLYNDAIYVLTET